MEQAIYLDQRINSKLTQVENLRSLANKVTTVYSDEPHGQHDNRRLEKTIAKIIDLENDIDKDIDKLVDLKKEITETINRVSEPRYRTILELRYLSFQTWEQIAVALSLDLSWVHRLHGRALKKITEKSHILLDKEILL